MHDSSDASFPPTSWSIIEYAQKADPNDYRDAVGRLYVNYWRPIHRYLRTIGCSHERALDLTQDFFTRCCANRDWVLARADRTRGKFRYYLKTILKRFYADHSAQRARKQEAFDDNLKPISTLATDQDRQFEPASDETADSVFMQQWALETMEVARRNLAEWCKKRNKAFWYDVFEAYNFGDSTSDEPTQEEIAAALNITRDKVRYATIETTIKFSELLRAEIASQVDSPEEIENELGEFTKLLQKPERRHR